MYRNTFPRAIRNDNNLLITLYLLLNMRQIGAVADELCISQSAVSQKLARLRDVFNDQLLVRTRGEMVLTAFSHELLPKLNILINQIEDVYSVINLHNQIRPTKKCYTISTYSDDYVASISIWLMSILNELAMEKEVSFKITPRTNNYINDLRNGDIDLFIGSLDESIPAIKSQALANFEFSFCVGKHHPFANKSITKALLKEYDFVCLSNGAEVLSKLNNNFSEFPNILEPVLQTQSTAAIKNILNNTSMFSFLSCQQIQKQSLAKVHIEELNIFVKTKVYWHELMENDTFHSFIRNRLSILNSLEQFDA